MTLQGGEAPIKKFTSKAHVYWADCDAAKIAYYGNFMRYLEMAEEQMFIALGHPRTDVFGGMKIGFPRVEVWIRYHKPARLGDNLEIDIRVEKRTRSSIVFRFEIRREGETDLVAEASSRLVCVNQEFHATPMPEEFLEILKDYLPPITKHPHEDIVVHHPKG